MRMGSPTSSGSEAKGKVRQLIDALRNGQRGNAALEVRLLAHDGEPAPSDEASAILTQLRRAGRMPLDTLVRDAAETFYRREMARDGANLGLGLLGPRHFVPVIQSAIEAGLGRLWEVQSRESQPPVPR